MGSGFRTFQTAEVLTASNVQNYLMEQSVMVFASVSDRNTAITTPEEGMVTYLTDINLFQVYTGSAWNILANAGTPSYNFVSTLYYTTVGTTTFSKATYPWLRALRVKCVGGGGAGAGATQDLRGGAGGAGGTLAESFITNIAGLAASITVTVGAGGTAGTGAGGGGGASSFGSLVSANGGGGGDVSGNGGNGGSPTDTATGDIFFRGQAGESISGLDREPGGTGGSSVLGGGGLGGLVQFGGGGSAGGAGGKYGGGGGGAYRLNGNANGGAGGQGIVIVELFA